MKSFRYGLLIFFALFCALILFYFLNSRISNNDHIFRPCGVLTNTNDPEKEEQIVALYSLTPDPDSQKFMNTTTVYLCRMKYIENCRYFFFSPTYYSDSYFLNTQQISYCKAPIYNELIITDNNDTVFFSGHLYPLRSVPEKMTLRTINDKNLAALDLSRKFDDRITNKPEVIIWEKFSPVPFFDY